MKNESPIVVYPLAGEAEANSAFGPPPAPVDTTALGTHPPADPYVPVAPEPQRQSWKTWLAGGVAAAVFGIGGFFGIQAVTNHSHAVSAAGGPGGGAFPGGGGRGFPGSGGTVGTIQSISGTTLTVATRNGSTVTVTTSAATTVTKATAGSVSAVTAGDHVAVRRTTTSNAVTADLVTDTGAASAATAAGSPPGDQDVSGVVASVGNGDFVVTETGGTTVTVNTTASTVVTVIQPSAVSSLAVGDSIRVVGTTPNGTVAATSIESGATAFGPGFGPRGGGGPGGPGGFGAPPGA